MDSFTSRQSAVSDADHPTSYYLDTYPGTFSVRPRYSSLCDRLPAGLAGYQRPATPLAAAGSLSTRNDCRQLRRLVESLRSRPKPLAVRWSAAVGHGRDTGCLCSDGRLVDWFPLLPCSPTLRH